MKKMALGVLLTAFFAMFIFNVMGYKGGGDDGRAMALGGGMDGTLNAIIDPTDGGMLMTEPEEIDGAGAQTLLLKDPTEPDMLNGGGYSKAILFKDVVGYAPTLKFRGIDPVDGGIYFDKDGFIPWGYYPQPTYFEEGGFKPSGSRASFMRIGDESIGW
ncbi:MAG: hypothetical protein V1835_06850 [Candidatus Micrarchaeota archaeon]